MSVLNQEAWIVCYRIVNDARRSRFVVFCKRGMRPKFMIRDHVVVIHTSDQDPNDVWLKIREFFQPGDRCVLYYARYDGSIEEVVMYGG